MTRTNSVLDRRSTLPVFLYNRDILFVVRFKMFARQATIVSLHLCREIEGAEADLNLKSWNVVCYVRSNAGNAA